MQKQPQKHSKLYIRVYNIINFIIGTPRDSRRRKWARYGMFLLLYLLLAVLLGRNITSRHYPWYANISVFLLLNINILLVLVLFVVLFRNLAKLMADRRKRIFGSRLQTKLVIFIVLLVTVPVFTTYFMSSSFIQNSIDRWFDSNVRQLADTALNLTDNIQKSQLDELAHIAEGISTDLVVERTPDMILEYLDKSIVNGLAVYGQSGYQYTQQNVSGTLFDFVNSRLVESVMAGNAASGYELNNPRPYYWVGQPIYQDGEIVGAIFAARLSSISMINDMKGVSELFFLFQQLRFFSPPVEKAFMVSYFLISMLVVFASIWGSMVFIRSITVPLQSLTKAASRLSKGESDARVEVTGRDELTLVSNAFNDMAEKLQQHTH
ncbi:MAG: HAMP domain-containing protein, partial [Deferribacteraceae bacterium]|nr:HAMP domain-containing protein [Deferribacteraceae bacterium]